MSRVLWTCWRRLLHLPVLAAVALLLLALFLVGNFSGSRGRSPAGSEPLTCRVTRGGFLHEVPAKGELESAVNVEVRCEVRAHRGAWIRILEVVPDGTHVEPGDFLIQLDSSGLEDEQSLQQVLCEKAQADVIRLQSTYEAALTAKQDYLQGQYPLDRQEADLAVFVAEDRLRRARQSLGASEKLEAQGYATRQQLRADQYAARAAETDLSMAKVKLHVLENYTKRRKLTQLNSALAATKALLVAAELNRDLSFRNLADLESQIEKCTIRAPSAGPVVLAHIYQNDHNHMVEPGETTMERRVLVRLPDPQHMQVRAKIGEENVAFVKPGLPVSISLEGLPEAELAGEVVAVNEYPDPEDWLSPGGKQYRTTIAIDAPLEGMKPGMTAMARILVQSLDNQLRVPSQAVWCQGEKSYCIIADEDEPWEAREVTLGPTNGVVTVIRSGLDEGQRVVLSPASYGDEVHLPDLPGEDKTLPRLSRGPDQVAQSH